jgi:hypothetical protein
VYLFDSSLAPVCAWINIGNINFDSFSKAIKLDLSSVEAMSGNCIDMFVETDMFCTPSVANSN